MFSTLLFSCQEESLFLEENQSTSQFADDGTVIKGRFFFNSKESLGKQIQKFEEEDISVIENKFETFYKNGFRSHTPVVNSENETLLTTFAKERAYLRSLSQNNYKSTEKEDDEDGFISDPFFAAVVNQNNEIIVGDTLYKYTEEKGLYFSHIKDSTFLFNYFNNEIVNKSINYKIASAVDAPCAERDQYGGITQVGENVLRYVAPIDEEGCDTGGGSSGGSSIPVVTAEENINTIINGLPECIGKAGSEFRDLFGKSFYCRSYWTDTRRIHTEFWSKNWLVYTSTGIMVKSQRKFLGVWNRSKVDELYLGINKILLKYTYQEPEIQYDPTSIYGFVDHRVPLYMYSGKFYTKTDPAYGSFRNILVNITKNKLPFFEFDNIDVLNIYIPSILFLGDYNINSTTGNSIYTQSNIKKLYKMGADFLKSKIGGIKDFVITYQKTPTEIEVLYFGEQHHKKDANLIKRYFYKDNGFLFKINSASNPKPGNYIDSRGNPYTVPKFNTKFGFEPVDTYFRDYTYYDLDFYAMGKRNGTWKGNRMVRNDNN